MSEADDRISHAKQLLKKFQSKKQHLSENGSSSTPNSLNGQGTPINLNPVHTGFYQEESGNESADHDHSYVHSVSSSRPCSTSLVDMGHRDASFTNENAQLRQMLNEKELALTDATGKLQALHTHYAELHNAYNLLSQSLNAASPEYAQQISQLQTALAVAIEEKTSLQSELRVTSSKLQESEAQKRAIQEETQRNSHSSTTAEIELSRIKAENQRLGDAFTNQSAQIEAHRKECSHLEAKILMVQQDRNDTQARLKNLYAEKEGLEKLIEGLKSELNMKEIYIRQLTRHSAAQNPLEDEKTIRSLTEEKARLVQESEVKKMEILEVQREMAAIRQHYESCIRELNENIVRLESELNAISTSRKDLESENYVLRAEIDSLKSQLAVTTIQNAHQESVARFTPVPEIDPIEVQALRNSLTNLQTAYENQLEKSKELERFIETKNGHVATLEETLFEKSHEIENLRQALEVRRTVENDVGSLSEQLQNEKATVSRAVAQNVELKDQLAELQDKLVRMANESAQREDERHTALRTIQRLREQIEEMNSMEGIRRETFDQDTQTHPLEQSTTIIREHIINPAMTEQEQQTELSLLNALVDETDEGSEPIQPIKSDVSTQFEEESVISTDLESRISNGSAVKFLPNQPDRASVVTSSSDEALLRHEMLKELEFKLEKATQEREQYKVSNERLEYWLAALETENETIGEYISIYRFQRNLIQRRLAEKDAMIAQLQQERGDNQTKLDELHLLINNLMATIHQTSASDSTPYPLGNGTFNSDGQPEQYKEHNDELPETNGSLEHKSNVREDPIHKMLEIISDLKARQSSSDEVNPLLHCTECKGKMITL